MQNSNLGVWLEKREKKKEKLLSTVKKTLITLLLFLLISLPQIGKLLLFPPNQSWLLEELVSSGDQGPIYSIVCSKSLLQLQQQKPELFYCGELKGTMHKLQATFCPIFPYVQKYRHLIISYESKLTCKQKTKLPQCFASKKTQKNWQTRIIRQLNIDMKVITNSFILAINL